VGDSRRGKTEWARSLGPAIYMCGQFNLDDWEDSYDTIILDDINFAFFPHWKCFFGSQKCFNVTDKYRKKRRVSGKLTIWLCNYGCEPSKSLSGAELEWYHANVKTFYLTQNLY
jgi:hypothetical protein